MHRELKERVKDRESKNVLSHFGKDYESSEMRLIKI